MGSERREKQTGYFQLLGKNQDFRRLFAGQLVSQAGDWFNSVALYTLLLSLTGKGQAVAYVLILKLLPTFFFGPIAGVVADRFNRKAIMMLADVLRGIEVLGFLIVRRPDQVWILYLLTGTEVFISTFFDPAKSAAIPNIVTTEDLVPANALSSASWSVTLAVGAALGGLVTDLFGRDAAFIIDSASFFVSAAFIYKVRIPPPEQRIAQEKLTFTHATGLADIFEGALYLKSNPRVVALLLVKTGWGLGGGVLLLLTIYGKDIFPLGRDGSASIGLLYAARGLGAMIGPIIAQVFSRGSTAGMQRAIGVAFFVSAAFYLLFAKSPALSVAAVLVIGAHAGGSIQWVYSTTLLQMMVPDRFRGRVFALDMALLTLTMTVSTYLTGWGLDHTRLGVRSITSILGLTFLVPGIAWSFHLWRLGKGGLALPPLPPVERISTGGQPGPETSVPPA